MKKGFTLAEILVSLSVLGVIAAMTLPMIITSTSAQKYRVGAKKAFSIASNTFELANLEGLAIADDDNGNKVSRTIYKEFVKITDESAANDTLTLKDGSIIDFSNAGYILIDINGNSSPNMPNYDQIRLNAEGTFNTGFDVTPQKENEGTGGTCTKGDTTHACSAILVYDLDGLFY